MPIGTHLVLHEHPDHSAIVQDGLLLARGVPAAAVESYHFSEIPEKGGEFQMTKNMVAVCGALRYIAAKTDLIPVGMGIGPFSLMTKLISDPIAPVFMAGAGETAEDNPEVALVERLLDIAFETIQKYLDAQIAAGAKAIILCEPAANKVYFSPNQLAESYDVFDRYVMRYNLALREQLRSHGVDLIFHDCGELLDGMVQRFATLDPAMISLGSSRRLWEDAALLPKTTVLYGNLPTKQFYSDGLLSVEKVRQLSDELIRQMRAVGHPFILGSECDILSVPGCEHSIKAKVEAFLQAT